MDKTTTLIIKSIGVNDGWVWVTETSGVGGSTAVRSLLLFSVMMRRTNNIAPSFILIRPACQLGVITSVTLKIQKQGGIGSSPFLRWQFIVDIHQAIFQFSVG